jgi:opacity protein-like surface antigen
MKTVFHAALTLSLLLFFVVPAEAMYTELGLNYIYKKSFIDSLNNTEQQGTTGSISLYFWDQIAIELSYTNSLMVKNEQNISSVSPSVRVTSEVANIYAADLIYVFADRKAMFQPYIKGGAGYMTKTQTTQIDNNPPWTVGPYSGIAPDYGIGLKFFITDSVAIRLGYDVVITPIDNNNTAQDINGRAGLSWIF